jgi:hypothetical protein
VLRRHGFAVESSLENGVAVARLVRLDDQSTDTYLRTLDAGKLARAHDEARPRPAPATAPACVSIDDVAARAFVSAEPVVQLGPSKQGTCMCACLSVCISLCRSITLCVVVSWSRPAMVCAPS